MFLLCHIPSFPSRYSPLSCSFSATFPGFHPDILHHHVPSLPYSQVSILIFSFIMFSKTGWPLHLKIPLRQFMLKHSSNFNILYIFRYITAHHTSFPILLISPFPLATNQCGHKLKDLFVLCQDSVQHSGGLHHPVSSHL
jgi:hypothetical protein